MPGRDRLRHREVLCRFGLLAGELTRGARGVLGRSVECKWSARNFFIRGGGELRRLVVGGRVDEWVKKVRVLFSANG
jgi:hypothetical protein